MFPHGSVPAIPPCEHPLNMLVSTCLPQRELRSRILRCWSNTTVSVRQNKPLDNAKCNSGRAFSRLHIKTGEKKHAAGSMLQTVRRSREVGYQFAGRNAASRLLRDPHGCFSELGAPLMAILSTTLRVRTHPTNIFFRPRRTRAHEAVMTANRQAQQVDQTQET